MISEITNRDVERFRDYVKDFYNEHRGIYPIASDERIDEAIDEYIESIDEEIQWGYGDSIDREQVRKIIQPEYQMF